MNRLRSGSRPLLIAAALACLFTSSSRAGEPFPLRLRSRVEDGGRFHLVERPAAWVPAKTALIVCDMWDLHHCLNAVRRGGEMAPTMDRLLKAARGQGAVIIHAPSGCVGAYEDHPARRHATATPRAKSFPPEIASWCYQIPPETKGIYPIDQSDGGEDDDPAEHAGWAEHLKAKGRDPRAPWKSQTDALGIEPEDYLSDSGEEIWSILEARGIDHVLLMGVHLNMCVLGRPFGLRRLAAAGKDVALVRDLTDTMYNPQAAPRVGHFAGTDLMVEHVEKFVAPSITSDQILGGKPFRFAGDKRPTVALLISEDEYQTDATLPAFASSSLVDAYRVAYILGQGKAGDDLPGVDRLADADVLIISARRRVLPKSQLDAIRRYVAAGRPIVGIRTSSHAFSPRAGVTVPPGRDAWPAFDAEVWGGNYHNHHPAGPMTALGLAPGAGPHPILARVVLDGMVGHGTLYKTSPLAVSATPLILGSIPGQPIEPVAWTNAPSTGNRAFYTSLGQADDFADPAFRRLLKNAIDWAARREASSLR